MENASPAVKYNPYANAVKYPYLDHSILDIFHQKLNENPYLLEIAHHFREDIEIIVEDGSGGLYPHRDCRDSGFLENPRDSRDSGLIEPPRDCRDSQARDSRDSGFLENPRDSGLIEPPRDCRDSQDSREITEVRISTMTVLCELGVDVNLDVFYEHLPVSSPRSKVREDGTVDTYRIVSLEYMEKTAKGTPKQKKRRVSTTTADSTDSKRRKSFYNQATIVLDYIKAVNLKLFRNGSIHITGIIDEEQGKCAVGFLCDEIRAIYEKHPDVLLTTETRGIDQIGCHRWDIVMINSDFSCNFRIRREKLFEILDTKYGLVVNYESDNYPGVKTSFYWNEADPQRTGICVCCTGKTCSGKGRGMLGFMADDPTAHNCRKITISVFQSGKIIITGARNRRQIDDAYAFITRVLTTHYSTVAKRNNLF